MVGSSVGAVQRVRMRRRELPLGRSALWFCLGLGTSLSLLLAGRADGLDPLFCSWPPMLVLAAAALLALGALPGPVVDVSRRAAALICAHGRRTTARIRSLHVHREGTGRRVCIVLAGGVRARLVWHLEAVDADRLAVGAVIPVRCDLLNARRAAFDTHADSRVSVLPVRTGEAARRQLRLVSAVAVAAGCAVGAAVWLIAI